jgi:hemin uptake protein HemP
VNKQTPGPKAVASTGVTGRLGTRPARIPSKVVLGGDRAVVIVHDSEEYLLRITADGKLDLSR